jgi:purine-binding chemotaxis protein CheW
MTTTAPLAADGGQYVTLGVDGEMFAVDVDQVREILDMRPISKVPNAPSFMLGMIDVRGQGVVVTDLRRKLGLPPAPPTEHTRIVVLDALLGGGTRQVGLVADKVFEVTPLAESETEAAPEVGVRWRSEYIKGIGRHRGAFVIILDLAHLFSTDEAAQIVHSEVSP